MPGSSPSQPRLGESHRWSWAELMALPAESVTVDIHCVTRWSKLDTAWRGVSLDTLLADVETEADFALVHSYGGYSTNLPLEDLLDGKAWVAYRVRRRGAGPRARRTRPAAGPAPVLLEVGQVGARHRADARGLARLLGATRLPRLRRPMARAAVPGGLKVRRAWRPATLVERRPETESASHAGSRGRRVARTPGWPAHRRTPDRARRLPGGPQLLARRACGRRPDRDHSAAGG